ncbi:penicillin-binding transpeptidase domain-containing protein [Brevibacillus composti]|uniref:Penicillin-binding transpeptidase domain-containing protein n=1 Tax=Brevibacillus composti TaxID=2796470 RepID=A0A7T5JPQ2_9BACL|nr:penicillin-binding transpeptidase domain-containing protein [Brevibacillus composti]QQE75524.1 penicillin-binding transpeptidase domain-containing protein [Brevibacillus composti]QUO42550.1 penicillin-binding transpeptidase domain-containing protein [Brevibacillus composti]
MNKIRVFYWVLLFLLLSGSGAVLGMYWLNGPLSEEEQAKAVFSEYVRKWEEKQFGEMYEQLSLENKTTLTKEHFIKRYQTIYEGIEAKELKVEAIFPENIKQEADGVISFHYRISMNTFVREITYTGRATLLKEKQGNRKDWFIVWDPSFLFQGMQEGDKVLASTIPPERGEIIDRAGRVLATSGKVIDVGINPDEWAQLTQQEKNQVSLLLQVPLPQLTTLIQSQSARPATNIRITTVQEDDRRLEQLKHIQGIVLRPKKVRYYPYGEATAHLIGYLGVIQKEELEKRKLQGYRSSDMIGRTGLEQLYEEKLRGVPGGRISITDAEGKVKKVLAEKNAEDGEDLILAIDAELQRVIYEEYKQDAGTAAAIQPRTGEILALVSAPAYDPNDFVTGMSAAEWQRINEHPQKPLLNRFTRGYAPGSTLKPITAAIGLKQGVISPLDEMNVRGLHWQKDGSWGNYYVTRVSDHQAPVNLQKALVYSDNIYFAQAALAIGEDLFVQEAEEFGFGEALPIPYPLEPSRLFTDGMTNEIQLADSGYGQGEVTMTPLHLSLAYSAFVNEGSMIYPRLFRDESTPAYWKEDVMPSEVASRLRQDLLRVVEDPLGTGRGARTNGMRIAGKTGTAELKQKKGELGKENGWFVAFDADHADFLIAMIVEDVRGRGGSHILDARIKKIFSYVLNQAGKKHE